MAKYALCIGISYSNSKTVLELGSTLKDLADFGTLMRREFIVR